MATETTALKPCPFCGCQPTERQIVEKYMADETGPAGEFIAGHRIDCDPCGIEFFEEYRDDVVGRWNTRV